MIKIHYTMLYRMLEGFARFFFKQFKKMEIPTYSLMCKRAKGLSTKLPKLSSCKPKTVIVDATGIKVQGEGEWKVKVHGKGRPRKWIKLHIAIVSLTKQIFNLMRSFFKHNLLVLNQPLISIIQNSRYLVDIKPKIQFNFKNLQEVTDVC